MCGYTYIDKTACVYQCVNIYVGCRFGPREHVGRSYVELCLLHHNSRRKAQLGRNLFGVRDI